MLLCVSHTIPNTLSLFGSYIFPEFHKPPRDNLITVAEKTSKGPRMSHLNLGNMLKNIKKNARTRLILRLRCGKLSESPLRALVFNG